MPMRESFEPALDFHARHCVEGIMPIEKLERPQNALNSEAHLECATSGAVCQGVHAYHTIEPPELFRRMELFEPLDRLVGGGSIYDQRNAA